MSDMTASIAPPSTSAAPIPPPGLINAAPGAQAPGYNPAQAQAATVTPAQFKVTPEQTVSGQIKNIIASGSPLMQQAEASAKNQMNQRGLINSSIGIGAGQTALYGAAAPIATADAATYANAAANTTKAQNDASTANAQLNTSVAQSNAAATNTMQGTAQQIAGSTNIQQIQSETSKEIARLQSDTTLTAQDKQDATSKMIAGIQSSTSISIADKQAMSAQVIAQLQSDTSLSVQDKASAAQKIIAEMNNANAAAIARIQADTNLSVQEKQNQSAQIIAGLNNQNAKDVQGLVNAGRLEQIGRDSQAAKELAIINNDNKLLLQTNSGAASLYSNGIAQMAAIMTNKDLDVTAKANAMNDVMNTIKDGIAAFKKIQTNQDVNSTLNFSAGPPAPGASPGQPPALVGPDGRPAYEVNGALIYSDGTPYNSSPSAD